MLLLTLSVQQRVANLAVGIQINDDKALVHKVWHIHRPYFFLLTHQLWAGGRG